MINWPYSTLGNEKCLISVKTPVGPTKRIIVNKIEMQGLTWGPLKCSVQMDQIGKGCLQKNKTRKTWY